jgi:ribonuclease E
MTKRMLIDAAHPEETRVVVLDGTRLVEFDYETSTKKQIKGNIYLAKVTRVEPSLQAAFVEYGGNRHGFLAFNEIHPDYYRIPVADREAALEADREAEADANAREAAHEETGGEFLAETMAHDAPAEEMHGAPMEQPEFPADETEPSDEPDFRASSADSFAGPAAETGSESGLSVPHPEAAAPAEGEAHPAAAGEVAAVSGEDTWNAGTADGTQPSQPPTPVETVGGDEMEETRRPVRRPQRHYKIQEVIKRRQIMLVQVTKEERGNKGAALTSYISLAGRYVVLMPNTPRGGGVSRKITSAADRRRLKDLMSDLELPEGMGVIVRTAGSERSKPEIKRDFEYLRRLWDEIRELTLKSTAPALVYEEGSLIKRSIRDLYSTDIEEVLIDGEAGYQVAKTFMNMLMPGHSKKVKLYRDPTVPLFHRYQVEGQLDAIHSPTVQLKSGGYIVLNPTEALVAIDVNSGRSTRERNIEETAYKTNLEASDEIARQLRLRDLAGLIVIDFIDMEHHRNQHAVERRLKEAMRHDRARIQLGRISPFGLLEMSRQRLRPSLIEASTQPCPYCEGTGHIRSTESTALHVLRAIEEEGVRRRSAEISVAVPNAVALYILNQKRATLQQAEARFGFRVIVKSDETLIPPAFRLERLRALTPAEITALPTAPPPMPVEDEDAIIAEGDAAAPTPPTEPGQEPGREPEPVHAQGGQRSERHPESERGHDGGESHEGGGRRRRRRGRRGGRGRHGEDRPHGEPRPQAESLPFGEEQRPHSPPPRPRFALLPGEPGYIPDGGVAAEPPLDDGEPQPQPQYPQQPGGPPQGEGERKRRRRGRRGGRRRRRSGGPGGEMGGEHMGDASSGEAGFQRPAAEPTFQRSAAEPAFQSSPHQSFTPSSAEPAFQRTPPEPVYQQRPEPPPAKDPAPRVEAERAPIQHNVPPVQEVSGPAANPKKGWWRR